MRTIDYEVYLITAPGYWYVGSTTIGAEKRFSQPGPIAGHFTKTGHQRKQQ